MPKTFKPVTTLLIIVLILSFTALPGCRFLPTTTPELDTVEEVWHLVFSEYVDRDSLDAAALGEAAVDGMLLVIDDPDTDNDEGDYYRSDIDRLDTEGLVFVTDAWDNIIEDNVYADRVDADALKVGAIDGIVHELDDPYSVYLETDYYEVGLSRLEGEFEGIGAYVSMVEDQLIIIAPIPDSPAEKAGIRAGDTILEVDGDTVAGMSLTEAILRIRGPEGTAVRLLVLHEDEEEAQEIEIVRAKVEVPSVEFEMMGDIAYIYIIQFSERTDEELEPVLEQLEEADAAGIIIDLRDNPGGLLSTVIEVASRFITDGVILEVVSNRDKVATFKAVPQSLTTDLPLVVLVNSFSASGSEVLSGALQDHDRAVVAGNVTYGKGSVNTLNKLRDGSGLYLTTSRWRTPGGRLIEGQGIEPDILLELTGEDAIDWAIDYLKENH